MNDGDNFYHLLRNERKDSLVMSSERFVEKKTFVTGT